MKKPFVCLLGGLALAPRPGQACDPLVLDLFAGKTTDIGSVTVSDDGSNLFVTYEVDEADWELTLGHVHAGLAPPSRSAPGRFPYHVDISGTSATIGIPFTDLGASPGDSLYVAAHAESQEFLGWETDWDAWWDLIPAEPVSMSVHWPGDMSYFEVTVAGGGLDGSWDGWCIDTDILVAPDTLYGDVLVVPVQSTGAAALVEHPENLDLVDYLLGLDWIGSPSPCGGTYTWGDVQRAVWQLIDDSLTGAGLAPWKQCRADEIEAAARAGGEGFVAECGDVTGLVLRPVEWDETSASWITAAQPVLIEVEMPCREVWSEETAWARGTIPFKTGWGSSFVYATCEP